MNSRLMEKAAPVLAFRAIPTALLALITYLSIYITLIATDVLPNVPKNQGGLNLKQAYDDLRQITAHPHPYNSHANDAVRSYLLSRLIPLRDQYQHVHISNDLISNGSWSSSSTAVYFEGTNILVKVDGTSTAAGGVLFSAHYDSVSTAPGSTDDGMGVVTLLQLVQYFAENRPLGTAVFNINNGEEDWLNGAHAFLEHSWSNLTNTFLNLEGAAAGGRPILFRASSTNPVRSFRSKHVPHPHANVISSDAFARGLIRSGTDYSVYAGPRSSDPGADGAPPRSGMQGLDLAFYKGRSRYHTKYDTVPYTSGGERSLWSMMEVAKGTGIELLNGYGTEDLGEIRDRDAPVYFDLFKSTVFVFPIINLLVFNIVILILGPITLVFPVVWKYVTSARHHENGNLQRPRALQFHHFIRNSEFSSSHRQDHNGVPVIHLNRQSRTDQLITIWTHSKFWIALVVTLALQVLLVFLYNMLNPFAVYSSPYIVLLSFLSLTYLSLNFVLNLPTSLPLYSLKFISATPAQQDKHVTFLHLYLFTWILLLFSTVGITSLKPGLGGGYLMSAWNTCVGLGCAIVAVVDVVAAGQDYTRRSGEEHVAVEEAYEELEGENATEVDEEHQRPVSESDESTPLIQRPSQITSNLQRHTSVKGEAETVAETWWWIPQFIVSVPLPIILFSHVTMLLLDAMPQTLSDGSSVVIVYALAALLALVLVLPLSPFMNKLHRSHTLSFFVLSLFVLSILYAWTTFPFSSQAPLRVFFQQRVEIDLGLDVLHSGSNSSLGVDNMRDSHRMITSLTGHPHYIPNSAIISNLPSAKTVNCTPHPTRTGLTLCEWYSGAGMLPKPGNLDSWSNDKATEYFDASVLRTGPSSARIKVKGRNTRSCRVYFDSQRVHEYVIHPSGNVGERKGMQLGYEIGERGVKELLLWSRTWNREFVVDIKWGLGEDTINSGLEGRIACEWAEYASGRIDHGSGLLENNIREKVSGKIPAFEEVLRFLPEWAVSSKQDDGLVEVLTPFSI